jgi:thioredoxin 1
MSLETLFGMANHHVTRLDDATFDAEVLGSESSLPVLVDFTAAWCGPCRALRPIVERIAERYSGQMRVAEVDIDEAPEVVRRYGIRGAPTVLVFRHGRETARQLGATTRERLLALCGFEPDGAGASAK